MMKFEIGPQPGPFLNFMWFYIVFPKGVVKKTENQNQ